MDGHTLVIRQGEETVRVSSDRVTAAPTPADARYTSTAPAETRENTPQPTDPVSDQEYVVERITGVKQLADGNLMYKIRWYGYTREHDT
jgi:hypothetical protein